MQTLTEPITKEIIQTTNSGQVERVTAQTAGETALAMPGMEVGLIALLLADKRSPQTRRAYAADLRDFFGSGQAEPAQSDVAAFIALSAPQVAVQLALYKNRFLSAGLSEATVNRRLAAVKSLLRMAYRIGLAQAANPIGSMSNTFASNMLNPVTVFSGPLTVSAASFPSGGSPNAFRHLISFSTPYTYTGGDLVIYITHGVSSVNGTTNGTPLDALTSNPNGGYKSNFRVGTQNAATGNFPDANVAIVQFRVVPAATADAPEPGSLALLLRPSWEQWV